MIIDVLKFIKQQLVTIKQTYDPEYIGLSIFSNESVNFSYILIPYIRKYLPGVKIIIGGRGIELTCGVTNQLFYEKYDTQGMADLIIVGDAETAFAEAIESNATGVYFAKPQTSEDLYDIPIPNWDDYDFEVYKKYKDTPIVEGYDTPGLDPRYITVTGSKGCVRHCTFCDVASFWPKYIYRDGEKIADEIIANYKKTGIETFRFTDNLMNGSITHYRKMNQKLAETIPNTIRYIGYAIFRSKKEMPAEDFKLAADAGCYEWAVGVEAGSERVRFDMKKKFTNEDMDHGIINLHKNNIRQILLLMVGYPTETESDYLETEAMLKQYASLNRNGMIQIGLTPTVQLLGNSPLINNPTISNQFDFQFVGDSHMSPYFWVSPKNPDNTFPVRYERFNRVLALMEKLNYRVQPALLLSKWRDELDHIKTIYDETKHKKFFPITRV